MFPFWFIFHRWSLFSFSGYNCPTWIFPTFALKIVAWFDATVAMTIPSLDIELKMDNSKVSVYFCFVVCQPLNMAPFLTLFRLGVFLSF